MKLQKIWINNQPKEHTFIVFHENTLYRRSVKKDNFYQVENELKQGIISDKFFGLPIPYLRTVSFRNDSPKLAIVFNQDSEDEVEISDNSLRKEVFDYLKSHTQYQSFSQAKPSIFSRIKKPLMALFVILGIFTYVYSIIDGINQGYEYRVVGRPGIASVVLALAHLGLVKNLLIFFPFVGLAVYRMVKNYQDDSEIHQLVYRK